MKNIKSLSVLNREQFDESYYSKFNATEAASEDAVGPAQYFYNADTYTTTINVASPATVGRLRYLFDNVSRGDIVNVSGLIQNVSCGAVGVIVEELDESGAYVAQQSEFIIDVPQDSAYKRVNADIVFISENNARNIRVSVGAGVANGGLFRMRDIKVSVHSSIGDPVPTTQGAGATIKTKMGAAWWTNGVWANRTDWPDTGFTISETANTTLVTFDEPFIKKPVVHVDELTVVTGGKKNAKVYEVSTTGFELAFYDELGVLITPANYTNNMFFLWSAIG